MCFAALPPGFPFQGNLAGLPCLPLSSCLRFVCLVFAISSLQEILLISSVQTSTSTSTVDSTPSTSEQQLNGATVNKLLSFSQTCFSVTTINQSLIAFNTHSIALLNSS